MPIVHPSQIDESYFLNDDGTLNHGEWRVFSALCKGLPEQWHVLPRARWLTPRKTKEVRGECDFLIIDPTRGILDLEVKTGVIWDELHGYTQAGKSIDPIRKAEFNAAGMANMLELRTSFDIQIGYALCFPDYDGAFDPALGVDRLLTDTDLAPDLITLSLELAFDSWDKRTSLPERMLRAIFDEVVPHMGFRREHRLEEHYVLERIEKATSTQYWVLNHIKDSQRIAVSGCAGTGKTKLAIETARYFATIGKSVLLTCFNNNLELVLRQDESLQSLIRAEYGTGLDVASFHHIADHFLNRANQQRNRRNQPQLIRSREWNDPRYAPDVIIAMKEFSLRYDVIVIDEGQDFDPHWVTALVQTLRDPKEGRIALFYDPHQQLYDRSNPAGIVHDHRLMVFPLFTNCRNPAPVHRAAMRYHQQGDMFMPLVDVGPEPLQVEVERSSSAQINALGQWLRMEKPDPHDVVVLTPHGETNSRRQWQDNMIVGNYVLTDDVEKWLSKTNHKNILCTSVYKFKGLEAPFVLVTELEGISDRRRMPILYTALSRAKYQLIYFLPKGLTV
jgi:hypothetical protein